MPTTSLFRSLLVALLCVLGLAAATSPAALAHQRHHTHHARRHHHRHHPRGHTAAVQTPAKLAASATLPAPVIAPPASITAPAGPSTLTPAPITGTTYYVSPTGSDTNTGTTPAQAWKTVLRANKATLKPGDGVLFQAGATFNDDTLMPGWGSPMSGTSTAPIVFGSYGSGQATLPQGVWVNGNSYLVFENLHMGPTQGVTGTANNITVEGCSIGGMAVPAVPADSGEIAINAIGSNWIIRDNTIDHTGNSGLLLRGDHYDVEHNTITNTGLDPAVTYGDHGIYLKATNSSVTNNLISNFHNDGVSVRYRNSIVSGNTITGGQFGIAWFQYDPTAGTSQWTNNTITNTSIVAIYVSPTDPAAGNTRESFIIAGNHIARPAPAASWLPMDLRPTTGTYTVANNTVS